jgi:hypothetical protein
LIIIDAKIIDLELADGTVIADSVGEEAAAVTNEKPSDAVAIISYDEKPGIQAIATTGPDLPPVPGEHASLARDFE